jgi:hypothetical protein
MSVADDEGRNTVLVVVDQLTGMVILIPCRDTDDARDTAEQVVANVISLHGVPEVVISDRDPKFTGVFWQSVCCRLGTKQRLSTAYHPQSDGKTERANAVMEEVLRTLVGARQGDWSEVLGMVAFAVNTSVHESTGMTPFFANYGFNPTVPWTVDRPEEAKDDPDGELFVDRLQDVFVFCRDALQRAKEKQAGHLNKRRRAVEYKVGDAVLLSTKHLNLRLPGYKLAARYFGPFTVTELMGDNAVRLDLPAHQLGFLNHDVVNVKSVRPYYARPERLRGDPFSRTAAQARRAYVGVGRGFG